MAEIVYPPVIALAKTTFRALDLRLTVEGGHHIPRTGGAVLVSNHVSYVDFILVGVAAQPVGRLVRFMAKESVFRHPVSGPLMRGMRHIPVDRSAGTASYRAALAALRAGELVGIFPEATISRSFTLKEFKSGAVRLAAGAQVPLVPVAVWGGHRLFTKGRKPTARRHTPITIAVGEPIDPAPPAGATRPDPTALSAELLRRLGALLDGVQRSYPDAPSGPEDRWWLPAHLGGTAPTRDQAARLEAGQPAADRADPVSEPVVALEAAVEQHGDQPHDREH